ncbi:MAG: hypothetical protein QOG77_3808 [Solirubrobacteraceae bacterium]|nr:hypothetical protein [Solirubrobacteraceae bacterium]
MPLLPVCRKWLPLAATALALAACGDDDTPAPRPVAAADPDLVERCSLELADGDFPDGLLPPGAAITGERTAIADGRLADVFTQLRQRPGFSVRDSELETLDAELELEGPDGEVSLQLELAPGCARATQITVR